MAMMHASVDMATNDESLFPSTRISLIGRLGDPANREWEDFFAIYAPIVYRMARHARLSENESEEVVAIVMRNFVGTVRKGFKVDHEIGRFRSYLRTITNRVISAQRDKTTATTASAVPLEELPDERNHDDANWTRIEREERLRTCLDRLRASREVNPRDMEAFERIVLQNESVESVARQFGLTANRLYGIKHTIIKQLQQMRAKLDIELGEV
jgi:RNA polymerase sigma-70 factor (ECF subfamily)